MATVKQSKHQTPIKYVHDQTGRGFWVISNWAVQSQKKAFKAYWDSESERVIAIEREVSAFMRMKTIEAYGSTRADVQNRFHEMVYYAECLRV